MKSKIIFIALFVLTFGLFTSCVIPVTKNPKPKTVVVDKKSKSKKKESKKVEIKKDEPQKSNSKSAEVKKDDSKDDDYRR